MKRVNLPLALDKLYEKLNNLPHSHSDLASHLNVKIRRLNLELVILNLEFMLYALDGEDNKLARYTPELQKRLERDVNVYRLASTNVLNNVINTMLISLDINIPIKGLNQRDNLVVDKIESAMGILSSNGTTEMEKLDTDISVDECVDIPDKLDIMVISCINTLKELTSNTSKAPVLRLVK